MLDESFWMPPIVKTIIFLTMGLACTSVAACSASDFPIREADMGPRLFQQCADCHSPQRGVNLYGPSLYCIVGRRAGRVAGYEYSPAIREAARKNLTWNEANIISYLENPHKFLEDFDRSPGISNKMSFMLADMQKREQVVAYLKRLNATCDNAF